MEKLNEYGIKYIESGKKYCKYYSLTYFEQANYYCEKYLSNLDRALLPKKSIENYDKQKNICIQKIEDINCGAIVLCFESFKGGYVLENEIKSIENEVKITIFLYSQVQIFISVFKKWKDLVLLKERTFGWF